MSHFLSCTDHFVSKEVFDIYKCAKCGFAFTQDAPEESEAGRYYESEDYISHSDSKKGITDKAYQIIRKIMLNRKKKIIRKITGLTNGSILDIGSGTGHFLNTMKRSGWKIKGVEINAKARDYSNSRFKINSIPPENIQILPANSYDCITLWHVLEHFNEPFKIMEEIARMLKSDGVCIIALPNSDSFDSKHYRKEWAAYDVPRHLWHFNPLNFSVFADKNKFVVYKKLNLPFDVFYVSILSEKYRRSRFPIISGAINGLMFSIHSFIYKSRSSSVIYVLRKSL
jgi:2-polyprenyl-3-methyl-5-hydroxy-6-metoxy-1,4-benzoquinol methylase